jgi:hypothetical protein
VSKAPGFVKILSVRAKKAKTYFLKKEVTDQYSSEMEEIRKSLRFIGFLCIATNSIKLPVREIILVYSANKKTY